MSLLYHADAELADAMNIAVAVGIAILGIIGLVAIGSARRDHPPGRSTRVSLVVSGAGIAAVLVSRLLPNESDEDVWVAIGVGLAILIFLAFIVAPSFAIPAYLNGRGRLAAVALTLSLVLPMLFVAWAVACGVTDACFH